MSSDAVGTTEDSTATATTSPMSPGSGKVTCPNARLTGTLAVAATANATASPSSRLKRAPVCRLSGM